MTFIASVNDDLLYRSPDGRECFIIFNRATHLVYVGTDIAEPTSLVGLTAAALREIADRLDGLRAKNRNPGDDQR